MIVEFQNVLTRILADRAYREQFLRNPANALESYSLTEREREALREIPAAQVERYAASLLGKRAGEFARAVPLTRKVCPEITLRYMRWLEFNPSQQANHLLDPGLAEALRALDALRNELLADEGEAPYCADLLAYEVLFRCSSQDGEIRRLRSRYRIDLLCADIRRGLLPMDPDPAHVLYQFEESGIRWKHLPQ
jgi:hypothetical protein